MLILFLGYNAKMIVLTTSGEWYQHSPVLSYLFITDIYIGNILFIVFTNKVNKSLSHFPK
jgi:hypothetical protein